MAKRKNQKLKLLYLYKIMLEETDENHPIALERVIHLLAGYDIDAERKSLYSDFEALRVFGLDVQMVRRNGAVGYFVGQRDFELPELKLLVDAVQSSRFVTKRKSASLIRKLTGLVSRHESARLERQVYSAGRVKTMNESIYYAIDTLHTAIAEGKRISFRYEEWVLDFSARKSVERRARRGGAAYVASPWALVWDDENYYLVAYDSENAQIRHYRVDKMMHIEVRNDPREGEAAFAGLDMSTYTKGLFGMFAGTRVEVRLRMRRSLVGVAVDRFGKDIAVAPDGDDCFVFPVSVIPSPRFLAWVAALGADAEILSPPQVRDDMAALLAAAASRYK